MEVDMAEKDKPKPKKKDRIWHPDGKHKDTERKPKQ
jgi:hypothetical protein